MTLKELTKGAFCHVPNLGVVEYISTDKKGYSTIKYNGKIATIFYKGEVEIEDPVSLM